MTTQQLIALIQKKASGFTPSEILLLINQVQEIILGKANYFKYYTDPATGMPPILATTLGTYEYSLPSAARVCIAVFAENLTGYSQINYNAALASYRYGGKEYYDIPCHKIPSFGSNAAKVIFIDNPPTQSTQYYCLYALKPTQVTAPTIQLELPNEFHFSLRQGVLAMIRDEKYGEKSDWVYFETVTIPQIQDRLNAMCRVRGGSTPIRAEQRDYPTGYSTE